MTESDPSQFDPRLATFQMLARYNTRANERLYDACAGLPPKDLARDRKAFFGSIIGTLNHLVVSDTIWMTRFEGYEASSTALDAILYRNLSELRIVRECMDRRIEAFFDAAEDDFFERIFAYENNEGRTFEDPAALCAVHFFNHQTHHRGQVHTMLTQTCAEAPVLDLHRVMKPDPETALAI